MGAPDWRVGGAAVASDGVTEAAGPGWTGRFERMTFGAGFHMHLGRLDIATDTALPVAGQGDGPTPISVYTLISGKAVFSTKGWPDLGLSPGRAILFVPQERRGVFHLAGPQVLRFFSVAMVPDLLASLLDGDVPPSLAPLMEGRATVVHERLVGAATRALVAGLGAPREGGVLHRLQREAVAIQLLTEIVGPELAEPAGPAPCAALSAREEAAVRAARARLLADLRDAPSAAELARIADVSLRRFLRTFEALHGASPAQLLRAERLNRARQMLEAGELPMKEIAWQVGYSHVSNFVTAFAEHYGAPPRRFARRGLAAE
jgi:AraC-like DNA-binding protein